MSLDGHTARKNVEAGVAQLVEQRIRNAKVGCSNPLTGTIHIQHDPAYFNVAGFFASKNHHFIA